MRGGSPYFRREEGREEIGMLSILIRKKKKKKKSAVCISTRRRGKD